MKLIAIADVVMIIPLTMYICVVFSGDYLSSSRDHKAVGRRPFDKMATLLAYLGPPEHKPVDSQ